jgi:hypothetical protein
MEGVLSSSWTRAELEALLATIHIIPIRTAHTRDGRLKGAPRVWTAREKYQGFLCFVRDTCPNNVTLSVAAQPLLLRAVAKNITTGMVPIAVSHLPAHMRVCRSLCDNSASTGHLSTANV